MRYNIKKMEQKHRIPESTLHHEKTGRGKRCPGKSTQVGVLSSTATAAATVPYVPYND